MLNYYIYCRQKLLVFYFLLTFSRRKLTADLRVHTKHINNFPIITSAMSQDLARQQDASQLQKHLQISGQCQQT